MLRTLPAGSSTLLLGREMFNIGQCGFITFHYFRKNKLISYCSGRKIRKQKQHEATIPKPRIPRDSSGFLDRLRRSLPWHVSAPSRWSRPLLLPSFVVLSPRGPRGDTRLGQVAQDTFRCWQSLQCWRLWA